MTDLDPLIRDNNFAGIMRACLSLLDELYDDQPKAHRQSVTLRGFIQSVYDAQTDSEPIRIAAIAAAAYNFLADGKSVNTIMLIPVPDLLAIAAKLDPQHALSAYMRDYARDKRSIDSTYHDQSGTNSERVGDADQPTPLPFSGWDGFALADLDDIARHRSALIPDLFPLAKDPGAYPHRPYEHMRSLDELLRMPPDGGRTIMIQPRMAGKATFLNNAFSAWIMDALYAMLAFQMIKGWYRPRKKDDAK